MLRFAAIGLDHRHIYDHVEHLQRESAVCVGHCPQTSDPRVLTGFSERFPHVPAVDRRRLLEDPSIDFVCIAAVPRDRAALAIDAMRHGKDVMVDKPGLITLDDVAAVQACVAETGRLFSICFSERFVVPAVELAAQLVAQGEIGRVVQTTGLGPHRLNRTIRPPWFFDPAAYGGILVDIASHQIDQFLFFTGAADARVVSSSVANFALPEVPGFEDYGELLLHSDTASGFIRVDWFTPDGLPTWGDGRLVLLGTEGYIELRKYIDVGGRTGTDHVFLSNRAGTRHIDASAMPLSYFARFLADVRDRTHTVMPQSHPFTVSTLAIEAQQRAQRIGARP